MARTLAAIRADLVTLTVNHSNSPDPDFATKQQALLDEATAARNASNVELDCQLSIDKAHLIDLNNEIVQYASQNMGKRSFIVTRKVRDSQDNLTTVACLQEQGRRILTGEYLIDEAQMRRRGIRS